MVWVVTGERESERLRVSICDSTGEASREGVSAGPIWKSCSRLSNNGGSGVATVVLVGKTVAEVDSIV